MQRMKSVRFEEVESMMEQMMKIPIIRNAERHKMLSTWSNSNDPNLIMDLRHKTIGDESHLPSVTNNAALAEVTRILMDEETEALYRKREREMLESELKKFEKGLANSRPRFRGPYTCVKRKFFENIDDYDKLWKAAPRRVKVRVKDISDPGDCQSEQTNPADLCSIETIKVTIKDKSNGLTCQEYDRDTMRMYFEIWTNYAKEQCRLRELKLKIQENMAGRRVRKYFEAWRERVRDLRRLATRKREEDEISDVRKIELFVSAINEKQKKMSKRPVTRDTTVRIRDGREIEEENRRSMGEGKKTSTMRIVHVVEPPAQNRLNAQKKIIAQQRMKLAEQNRIIEELRLGKIENDSIKAGRDTINVAKEALAHCGQRTRRTLMQLMRVEGCRDKTLLEPPRIPSPPRFLARMEARAEARRERVRLAEEERKRKLEEQRTKEEIARREEEENRKRLQLEAQREAKRIREEQEKKRARELERSRLANDMAEKFYRKYLMRRYIMEPLASLVELKRNYIKIALNHYDRSLMRKFFKMWQRETNDQHDVKLELSITIWRRNLLSCAFKNWLDSTRCEIRKNQVAMDFYELRLQERCLKFWCDRAIEAKIRETENDELANCHMEMRIKWRFFEKWRRYMKISDDVRESDRRREIMRALVQRVVPDFDPKQRGVIIDD